MPLFTSKARVPVVMDDDLPAGDPAQNTVYIKARMNYRDTSTYKDFLINGHVVGDAMQMETRIGTAELELLRINILAWTGPDFADETGQRIPYSAAAVDDIDPNEPFWQKVLGEINQRNKRAEATDPKKLLNDGTPPSTESTKDSAASMTSSLVSRNGIDGRRIKSVN